MRTNGKGLYYCKHCGFDCTLDPHHARRNEAVALEMCPARDGDFCEPKRRVKKAASITRKAAA